MTKAQSIALNAPSFADEKKKALFDMSPFKSPGPDEIHAGFYQKMWHIVGNSIYEFTFKFFPSEEIQE